MLNAIFFDHNHALSIEPSAGKVVAHVQCRSIKKMSTQYRTFVSFQQKRYYYSPETWKQCEHGNTRINECARKKESVYSHSSIRLFVKLKLHAYNNTARFSQAYSGRQVGAFLSVFFSKEITIVLRKCFVCVDSAVYFQNFLFRSNLRQKRRSIQLVIPILKLCLYSRFQNSYDQVHFLHRKKPKQGGYKL